MKKKVLLFYGIALLFLVVYLVVDISSAIELSEIGRLFLLCESCFFLYFGGLQFSKYRKDNKPMKVNLWLYFFLYLLLLITLTLFDVSWGRHGFQLNFNFNHFLGAVNLIPFKTIMMYIKQFNSMYSSRQVLLNLFGNLIALMPMAFFLPLLFKKQNKFLNFIFTTTIIIFSIEFLQLITSSGNFDIDDFILNLLGASIMFGILKIKPLNHLIRNIFLLEKNEISKKDYIIIFSSIFFVFVMVILIVMFRNKLYHNPQDDYMKKINPKIEIVDETETCEDTLDQFYEDELKIYYFPCMKSDKVYAIINEKEKYLVKDILKNENFKYSIDINRILYNLDHYQVSYIKKDKYQKISVSMDIVGSIAPDYNFFIGNSDVLGAKYGKHALDNHKFILEVYLIPKKSGSSNLEVILKDEETKIKTKYLYRVTVDENLKTTYKLIEKTEI